MDPLSSAAVVRKTPPCTSVDTPLTTTVAASSPPTKPSEPRPFIASPVLAFSKPTIQDNSSRKAWGLLEVAKKAMKHGDLGWLITAVIDELFPAPLCARQRVSSDNFDLPSSPRGRTMSADFDPSSVFDPRTLPVISSPMTSPTTLPGTLRPVQGKIINAMDVDSLVVNCLKGRGISLENVDLGLIKMVLICLMTSAGSSATSASTQSHSQGAAFALAVAAAAHGTCGVEGGFMPFHEGRRSRVPTSA
ncbi:hypothetical protein BC829DRAFT_393576 [Chytridium lagenaria]|nr:hypothetical protein BC829DRAFT_393576 [Chytridium lagenaria]